MTTSLSIQQAAAATGLSVHTLRYYERIGLLDPIRREDNTHRRFREEDLRWIGFLLKLRATGLPIRDMLHYAQLRRAGDTQESVSARKALLQQHTQTVQQRLTELQSNLAVLHQKIAMYDSMESAPPVNVMTQSQTIEDASHEHSNKHTNSTSNSNSSNIGTSSGRTPARR